MLAEDSLFTKLDLSGVPEATIRTFLTLLNGLDELKAWLKEENCRHVAMESTGVYGSLYITY